MPDQADESFDEFQSSWPTTSGDTVDLYLYGNDNLHRNGMSQATTVIIESDSRSSTDEYDSDSNDEEIEEAMYDCILNSVFALSLMKDENRWKFLTKESIRDNPFCILCRKENES